MRAGLGLVCQRWISRVLILVLGLQEVAWSVPVPTVIEFPDASALLRKSMMDKAPNGVDIVHTFPSDALGVFLQPYQQFDVGEAGLIFNNFAGSNPETMSLAYGETGGLLLENPLLKGGLRAAEKIVQVVEGGAPTRLSGSLEVYGKQAELLIANPAGFILDHVSFLNMSKVTLITGKLNLGADGSLAGVEVQDQSSIEAHFDAAYLERVGQLSLISSLVKLSGEATLPPRTHLKILSGVGAYDLQQETFQPFQTARPRVHPYPVSGIDAKAMGTLKVGSAQFEVLQAGGSLGAPQTLIASKGSLHLEAQGQVQLGNLKAKTIFAASYQDQLYLKAGDFVHAAQNLSLFSKKGWVQPEAHHLVAGGAIRLTSDAGLSLGGQVQAKGSLEVSAKSLTQTQPSVLQAQKNFQISVLGGHVEQAGVMTSVGGALSLSAGTFSQGSTGVIQAQGDTTLRVDQQATVRGLVFSHGGTLSLSAAALCQEQGKLYGGKGVLLTLTGSGPLVTLGEVTSHGSLKVTAGSWTHGVLDGKASPNLPNTVYAKDGIDVQVAEALHLGSRVETGGTLTFSGKQIKLQETGSILGDKGVHIQALEKLTTAGTITSDQGAVKLIAPSWQQTQGKVEGHAGVTVQVEELTTWGEISSLAGALLIRVKNWVHRLLNTPGKASPNTVQGVKGITVEAEKNVDFEGSLTSTSGKINLAASTFRLQEKGELSGSKGVNITASQMATTFGKINSSAGAVTLTSPSWFHRKGAVVSAQGLTLKADQLTTTQGSLDSEGKILLQTKQWSSQDVPPNTWYTLRGIQGVDLQVEQEMKPGVFVESAAGKVTLKAKKMGGASSAFLGHGGVEIAVETP
ncbi:MAG: filamentous hemagglutinin N-terminal domain-containing protein, partial [Alphaproteobacteria bacterium]